MYLVVGTASQQDFDSTKTWKKISKWIEIAMSVMNGFFVIFFKDYAQVQANPRLALFISVVIFIGPWIVLIPLILVLAPLILIQEAYVLVLTVLGFSVMGVPVAPPPCCSIVFATTKTLPPYPCLRDYNQQGRHIKLILPESWFFWSPG